MIKSTQPIHMEAMEKRCPHCQSFTYKNYVESQDGTVKAYSNITYCITCQWEERNAN